MISAYQKSRAQSKQESSAVREGRGYICKGSDQDQRDEKAFDINMSRL